MSGNQMAITYIGDRDGVQKQDENGRRWTFMHSRSVFVPERFARILIATREFIEPSDLGRPFIERCPEGGLVVFRRWGALGDLIMFRAATSAFVRRFPQYQPILRCQKRFGELFAFDPLWKQVIMIGAGVAAPAAAPVGFFDQVAEADHRGSEEHRVKLFTNAMAGPDVPLELAPSDWMIPTGSKAATYVAAWLKEHGLEREARSRPLVAVQPRGSGPMKTLPKRIMIRLIAALIERGYDVVLIEHSPGVAAEFTTQSRVYSMPGRDPLHGIELLRHCDLAVTMDSGALWMAHAAPCATLVILGPTRPAQRISLHPWYPAGARAVCLNEIIECPACFESAKACKGKYTCLHEQPDWGIALRLITDEAESMLSGDVRLPLAKTV